MRAVIAAVVLSGLSLITACAGGAGGDEAHYRAYCSERGLASGSAEFDACVADRRATVLRWRNYRFGMP